MAKKEDVKVIAPSKNNKVETLDEVQEETTAIPNSEIVEIDDAPKPSKGKKILSEIKAFLILALIIGLVGGGTWYWYTHFYDSDKNKVTETIPETEDEYKVISYTSKEKNHDLIVLGDYLVERVENHVVKVMDLSTKVLYEGTIEYSYLYLGIDQKLYFVLDESGDYENSVSIYRLDDNKVVEVETIETLGVYYSPLVYSSNNQEYLVGFLGDYDTQNEDGEMQSIEYIHLLDGTKYELNNTILFGSGPRIGANEAVVMVNEQYVITYQTSSQSYGLYDIKNGKSIIDPSYEMLKDISNNRYVAVKDGKAGIINLKREILVNFQYDFIDVNDGFFVVGKDGKMAIMDDSYHLVTDFVFDEQSGTPGQDFEYSYYLCCASVNTFKAFKVQDKYILYNNVRDYGYNEFEKHETYFIDSSGKYETIQEKSFDVADGFIYAEIDDNKYDEELKEKYTIDLTKYDFDIYSLALLNGNTIIASNEGDDIYIDYETGKEIKDINPYEQDIDNFHIKFENGKLTIKTSEKNEISFDISVFDTSSFVKKDDTHYYYINEKSNNSIYIMIQKEE